MVLENVTKTNAYKKLYDYGKYLPVNNSYIAGGAIKDILDDKNPRDLDIYFENDRDFDTGLEWYKWSTDFDLSYQNDNVIAFIEKSTGMVVELIGIVKGTPKDIINTFDFTIDKVALVRVEDTYSDGFKYSFYYKEGFFESLTLKNLVIDGDLKNPIASFKRLIKYSGYGYSIDKYSEKTLLDSIKLLDDDRYGILINYVIIGENDSYE